MARHLFSVQRQHLGCSGAAISQILSAQVGVMLASVSKAPGPKKTQIGRVLDLHMSDLKKSQHQPAGLSPRAVAADSTKPGRRRRKSGRDLSKALSYRPRDLFDLHGMPPSTVCQLCNHPDPEKRMPSFLIPGRQGRKGARHIPVAEFNVWLDKWRTNGGCA
jgi:hypothetical protein